MGINGPGRPVTDHHRRRRLVLVQVAQAAGSPEAWMSLLPRIQNIRMEATRDGDQDSGRVLLWAVSPTTSSIVGRQSLGRRQLRTIGNEFVYLGHRFSGVDLRLLPLGMRTVGRALLTLAR
jgi:hypothetical protein